MRANERPIRDEGSDVMSRLAAVLCAFAAVIALQWGAPTAIRGALAPLSGIGGAMDGSAPAEPASLPQQRDLARLVKAQHRTLKAGLHLSDGGPSALAPQQARPPVFSSFAATIVPDTAVLPQRSLRAFDARAPPTLRA